MSPIALEEDLLGDRVRLRIWQAEDVQAMYEICQDPDIQTWSGLPVPFRMEDAEAYIGSILPEQLASGSGVSFAIVADDGTIAGGVGLYGIGERQGEASAMAAARVWLAPEHRKSGLAAEAVRLMAVWAFTELRLDRIVTYSLAGNVPARRVTELVGFGNHAVLRSAVLRDGGPADLWYSDLIPADLGLNVGGGAWT